MPSGETGNYYNTNETRVLDPHSTTAAKQISLGLDHQLCVKYQFGTHLHETCKEEWSPDVAGQSVTYKVSDIIGHKTLPPYKHAPQAAHTMKTRLLLHPTSSPVIHHVIPPTKTSSAPQPVLSNRIPKKNKETTEVKDEEAKKEEEEEKEEQEEKEKEKQQREMKRASREEQEEQERRKERLEKEEEEEKEKEQEKQQKEEEEEKEKEQEKQQREMKHAAREEQKLKRREEREERRQEREDQKLQRREEREQRRAEREVREELGKDKMLDSGEENAESGLGTDLPHDYNAQSKFSALDLHCNGKEYFTPGLIILTSCALASIGLKKFCSMQMRVQRMRKPLMDV